MLTDGARYGEAAECELPLTAETGDEFSDNVKLADLPDAEKPREKLWTRGPGVLSNAELLAILLHTGTAGKSVLRVAEAILARTRPEGISRLANIGPQELKEYPGIGVAKACTIMAAIELGRRAARPVPPADISTIERAVQYVRSVFADYDEMREHFVVIPVDSRNHPLAARLVSIGSLNQAMAHPREVLREVIRYGADAFIVAHNHPSGDPEPSANDLAITARLVKAGDIVGIKMNDHIIIAGQKYISFHAEGMIK